MNDRPDASTAPRLRVLVEGLSDKAAIEALAARRHLDLGSRGIEVVSIGGAHGIGPFLRENVAGSEHLAGLCDAGEEPTFRRALERAGFGRLPTRRHLEKLGFFICDRDLEDELIRAMGTDAVLSVVDAFGETVPFRTLQRQPAHRGRPIEDQLHRFMGTHSGRKILYARVLIERADGAAVPDVLNRLLAHMEATQRIEEHKVEGWRPMLTIRPATPSDVEVVTQLVANAYGRYVPRIGREPAPMSVDYAATIGQDRVWLAQLAEAVVGVVVLEVGGDHVHLENVAVSPEWHGRGIGSDLIAFAEQQARDRGLHEIRLYTNELMAENIDFYTRRGFVETHRTRSDGFNRVHFSKTLIPDATVGK